MKKLTDEGSLSIQEICLLEEESNKPVNKLMFRFPNHNRTSLVHALSSQDIVEFYDFEPDNDIGIS